jgi:hypothetical protein
VAGIDDPGHSSYKQKLSQRLALWHKPIHFLVGRAALHKHEHFQTSSGEKTWRVSSVVSALTSRNTVVRLPKEAPQT